MPHVPECVWQCSAIISAWRFYLPSDRFEILCFEVNISISEYQLELPVWNCASVGDCCVYLRSVLLFFRIIHVAYQCAASPEGGQSPIRKYCNSFKIKKKNKNPLTNLTDTITLSMNTFLGFVIVVVLCWGRRVVRAELQHHQASDSSSLDVKHKWSTSSAQRHSFGLSQQIVS